MAYPDDKETFRRVVNQELPDVEGDIVDEDDQNLPAKFLEDLQDTLGYGIKMGYASVKAFFDYVVTQIGTIAGKVSKTGDTMTGDLRLEKDALDSSKLYLDKTGAPSNQYLWMHDTSIELVNLTAGHIRFKSAGSSAITIFATDIRIHRKIDMFNNDIENVVNLKLTGAGDITHETAGRGIILKTPDGTKNYKITINDAGNVITTLQ